MRFELTSTASTLLHRPASAASSRAVRYRIWRISASTSGPTRSPPSCGAPTRSAGLPIALSATAN